MTNPLTATAHWLTRMTGLDDRFHFGLSFSKIVIAWFAYKVGEHISVMVSPSWALVILVLILVAAAFGPKMLGMVIDLLKAKWSASSNDNTSINITGNAAEMIKAARERRDPARGFESSGKVAQVHDD